MGNLCNEFPKIIILSNEASKIMNVSHPMGGQLNWCSSCYEVLCKARDYIQITCGTSQQKNFMNVSQQCLVDNG